MIEVTCNDRLGKKVRVKCKYPFINSYKKTIALVGRFDVRLAQKYNFFTWGQGDEQSEPSHWRGSGVLHWKNLRPRSTDLVKTVNFCSSIQTDFTGKSMGCTFPQKRKILLYSQCHVCGMRQVCGAILESHTCMWLY